MLRNTLSTYCWNQSHVGKDRLISPAHMIKKCLKMLIECLELLTAYVCLFTGSICIMAVRNIEGAFFKELHFGLFI